MTDDYKVTVEITTPSQNAEAAIRAIREITSRIATKRVVILDVRKADAWVNT